jgi:hypothetical protein
MYFRLILQSKNSTLTSPDALSFPWQDMQLQNFMGDDQKAKVGILQ